MLRWLLFLSAILISSATFAASSPLMNYSSNKPAVDIQIISQPEIIFPARSYSCGANDFYPDNPARAFTDTQNRVHLFANNSSGYYQLIGNSLNGPFTADCSPLLTSVTNGHDQNITKYKDYVWLMSSWAANDGNVIVLVHNEFHGEKFGKPGEYCSQNSEAWKLPECQYWNIVAARSTNDGQSFHWIPNDNGPAYAVIASPYKYNKNNPQLQGMPAQTNIVQDPHQKNSYYLLVQNYTQNGNPVGVCLFHSKNPLDSFAWRAWDGHDFTIAMDRNPYTTIIKDPQVCKNIPSLPPGVSVTSVTYHQPTKQFILTGNTTAWPTNDGGKEDAFVYFTSSDLLNWSQPGLIMPINWWNKWFPKCDVVGQAYPSLLDPNSHRKNFDYSAATPYLYYTQLNANEGGCKINNNVNDRSLVRIKLEIEPS